MNDIAEWSAKTFENETSLHKLNHLTKEIDELKSAIFHEHGKYDINMEFADCFILLLGAASLQGLTASNIHNIIECKMAINKNRTWSEPDINGVVEHVK
jgi:NTP pyrophosphatase (non-canonical NTP hydrolase)